LVLERGLQAGGRHDGPSSGHRNEGSMATGGYCGEEMSKRSMQKSPVFRLTPMQEGMLFHCLASPRSGVDVVQIIGKLREELDIPAFRRAWQRLVDRHEALRLRFTWDEEANARQFPLPQATLAFELRDWRGVASPEQERQFECFLDEDRSRGFDPGADLLIRVALFHLGDSVYRLVWTLWHGILDGRSCLSLLLELFCFYEAFQRGEAVDLPLPRSYTEYTEWLASRDTEFASPFWKQYLADFDEPTTVNISVPRAGQQGESFGRHEIRIPQPVASQLKAAAKAYGVTMNTMLQGAWALVLSQYSGKDDVLFGTTRACRKAAFDGDGSGDGIIGLLTNTVPMRIRIPLQAEVSSWLRELRAQQLAMRPYEHSPLVEVQACTGVRSDRRLFDSILAYDNQMIDSILQSRGGVWLSRRFDQRLQSGYPLTVEGFGGSQLSLAINNDRALVDDPTARRMLAYLVRALEALAAHPETALAQLPLVPEEERRLLLEEWNRTGQPYPENCTIQKSFEEQAAKSPGAPALTCRGETWTYRELDHRAEKIARRLRAEGAGPESVIGICMERSLDLIAGMLGILKSGAAYLPLDPMYPNERLAVMIEDARPILVLTKDGTQDRCSGVNVRILSVDGESFSSSVHEFSDLPHQDPAGGCLAYLIYTSGSTGKPKGVMVEHRNVMNFFSGMDEILGREPGVWLAVASVSFDISVLELWWSLTRGYHVVLWPGLESEEGASIPDLIRRHAVTHMQSVPSFLRMVIARPGAVESLAMLRTLFIGGEAVPPALIRDLGLCSSRRILDGYGPTETTVISTTWEIEPGAETIAIGRPIANTQLYVLDEHRRIVPVGVVGELCIGGAGVARGYLNRPELCDEKFIPNPFSGIAGDRLYRTGDLVRFRSDGALEYAGRSDEQVKIRGHRVELGEIEAVLGRHPDVRAAAVDAQDGPSGEMRLVAYAVPGKAGLPPPKELREWMGRELPAYMVPAFFVPLDTMPLNSNANPIPRKGHPPPWRRSSWRSGVKRSASVMCRSTRISSISAAIPSPRFRWWWRSSRNSASNYRSMCCSRRPPWRDLQTSSAHCSATGRVPRRTSRGDSSFSGRRPLRNAGCSQSGNACLKNVRLDSMTTFSIWKEPRSCLTGWWRKSATNSEILRKAFLRFSRTRPSKLWPASSRTTWKLRFPWSSACSPAATKFRCS
jgi:amino acid adenylation domain-containing protein